MVVAMAQNGVIGRDGALPWRLRDDLKFFKQATLGKPIIMGRTTYESLGRPLPGRDNIVMTRGTVAAAAETFVVGDLDRAIALGALLARDRQAEEITIIGGGSVYREAMPRADRLLVTRVRAEIDGDTRFALPPAADWRIETLATIAADDRNDHPARIEQWDRRSGA